MKFLVILLAIVFLVMGFAVLICWALGQQDDVEKEAYETVDEQPTGLIKSAGIVKALGRADEGITVHQHT